MTLKTINKSLIEADTKYILHQCNCVSENAKGIAKSIFDAFPWANTYSKREKPSSRGTVDILGNGKTERFVINAYIQYYPGKSYESAYKSNVRTTDTYENRLFYLQKCLQRIENISDLESIGIPVGMGCRLAKGNWSDYLFLIEDFAKQIKSEQNAEVILYNYDNKKLSNQESLWK